MPKQIHKILTFADIITSLNIICGLLAIMGAINHRFAWACVLILVGALFDGIDGLVARRLNISSDFGAELDSLADLVSFGVAPMVIVMSYYNQTWLSLVAVLIPLCGALRLARHNIHRSALHGELIGVPIDASALVIPVLLLLKAGPLVMGVAIILLAAAYLSTAPVKKLL